VAEAFDGERRGLRRRAQIAGGAACESARKAAVKDEEQVTAGEVVQGFA
jgi:hypothetical protein